MEKIKKILIALLHSIAVLVAICSILSLFRNTESRYLKMLDFPRIQFFLISVVSLISLTFLIKERRWYTYILMLSLFLGLVINGRYLVNYTPLVSITVPNLKSLTQSDELIRILIVNVKMSNRNSQLLL